MLYVMYYTTHITYCIIVCFEPHMIINFGMLCIELLIMIDHILHIIHCMLYTAYCIVPVYYPQTSDPISALGNGKPVVPFKTLRINTLRVLSQRGYITYCM